MDRKIHKKPIFWIGIIVFIITVFDVYIALSDNCNKNYLDSFYESLRLITANHQFDESGTDIFHGNDFVRFVRFPLFALFLFFTYRFVINVLFPKVIDKLIVKYWFKNHYVIFGNSEMHIELIRKIDPRNTKQQVVLIVMPNESKSNLQDFQSRYFKIIEGDPLFGKKKGSTIFNAVNFKKVSKFFVVTKDDNINIEIARNVWAYLTDLKNPHKNKKVKIESASKQNETAIRCYTLVKNRDLKNILEETPIFKYERNSKENFYFDGVAFNLDSIGIQYGVNANIQHILPDFSKKQPIIFIDGLNEAAISIIQNLSHIITKANEKLMFHITETDEDKIKNFDTQYAFLKDFADFIFCFEPDIYDYSSIFVCTDNPTEAINKAVEIRYRLKKEDPTIFLVTSRCGYIDSVFNATEYTEKKTVTFEQKSLNIKLFNRTEYFWDLVVKTKKEIAEMAEKVHLGYNETTEELQRAMQQTPYENLTERYKQSNLNAALDFYIKTYIQTGKTFEESKGKLNIDFENDMEYLAEIEHRRWTLDYFADGWQYGEISDDKMLKNEKYKIHECLLPWKDLDNKPKLKTTKEYDRKQILLLQQLLNPSKNESI